MLPVTEVTHSRKRYARAREEPVDCYRCGQEGHARSQCPERWPVPAAPRASPGAVTDIQRVPVRREPDPPTPGYLQTREQAGMPSHAEYVMTGCPWCHAGPRQQCINVGTQRVTYPHQARLDAAGIQADTARRELARQQVAEARAQHPDLDAWFHAVLQREQRQVRVPADGTASGHGQDQQAGQRAAAALAVTAAPPVPEHGDT